MKTPRILLACAVALAIIGVGGATAASASSPAAASSSGTAAVVPNGQCAATGTVTLSTGIGLPTSPTANVGFTISVRCAGTDVRVTASGTLTTASCGRSSGSGSLGTGQTFNVETAGGTFVLTGQVTGGGQVVVDATKPNNSCLNGTATQFIATGAINW